MYSCHVGGLHLKQQLPFFFFFFFFFSVYIPGGQADPSLYVLSSRL